MGKRINTFNTYIMKQNREYGYIAHKYAQLTFTKVQKQFNAINYIFNK